MADLGELAAWLGLPVFPCLVTKVPATPHGFKDATRDPDAIRELWKRHPGPLVGVATGEASGIDVLDVDPRNGGRDWFEAHRAKIPQTRIHRTRSGGVHVLFRHLTGLRNSSGKVATGIDVRADGGYVVWWPMERLQTRGSIDALSEWPLWLWPSLMRAPTPPPPVYPKRTASRAASLPAIAGLIRTVAIAPQGQRNTIAYWAAHRMREIVSEGKIASPLAREILLEAASRCGLPPNEASRTIDSGMRGGRP